MPEQQGIVKVVSGRRGRGPGMISVLMAEEETPLNLTSFDSALLKQAAFLINKEVKVSWEEKQSKDGTRTFLNLQTLQGTGSQDRSEAPGSIVEAEVIPPQRETGQTLVPVPLPAPPPPEGPEAALQRLELGYLLANRRHELILQLLRERFKEGVHYMDGKTFGSDKPVLLQPGAHSAFQAFAFSCNPQVIAGPLEAPKDPDAWYTIVVRTEVRDSYERFVGAQMGSCSSHIWSYKQNNFVPRAVDPDKCHNATLKMAVKRSVVAACRQTTPASEVFAEDIEESGYGETRPKVPTGKRGFIKR